MESLSIAVIEAVARAEGVDPRDLDPPLDQAVDPDALDRLFAPQPDGNVRDGGEVRFHYMGYEVVVAADSTVELR